MSQPHFVHSMSEQQVRTNKLKLIGIFAVALVPVALAFLMYFGGFAVPSNKTNKGDLIWPPVEASVLGRGNGTLEALVTSKPNWYLMLSGTGVCDERCEELAQTIRQVNVSMGREMERVSRVVLSEAMMSDPVRLRERFPELMFVKAGSEQLAKFEGIVSDKGAAVESGVWSVWLVDPLGNILIHYGSAHDGYDMIDDLKKLLKLSNIG